MKLSYEATIKIPKADIEFKEGLGVGVLSLLEIEVEAPEDTPHDHPHAVHSARNIAESVVWDIIDIELKPKT